ncbi:MAG TPA: N-formylglutamate deformylase [Rhodanobacteraceae bacterium]|nr:N-formylglutamate deformylase [Rhodanobacteraceae bacterium]
MDTYSLHRGRAPLLVSLPHDSSAIPDGIATRMTEAGRRSPDTDWHVGRLYECARELGASVLRPRWSRYVVDLNRPRDGHALYPGKNETGLVPTVTFAGEAIYSEGETPSEDEVGMRAEYFWQPYHAALAAELDRLRARHGHVVLWDGHSIRSQVPMFFEGTLPDLNLGSADGASCSAGLQRRVAKLLEAQTGYSHVVNGRFKGGYITRRYGQPDSGVDALQLELAQATYMDEDSFEFRPDRAVPVQALIQSLLATCLDLATA